jgi:transposase InsO family protein
VTAFCAEQGISRKTFYAILKRARDEGPAAALEPRSRRPKSSPNRTDDATRLEALQVRASLEQSGLDHGPISVFEKMRSMGSTPPSTATLARLFREKGVARFEPLKKPRAAYRRFVYPAPNACWQLDATEYVLTGGRKCAIFQLQDDHSRLAVATLVAAGETSDAAVEVMRKGIAARGVPQRLLTDNGAALNSSRRGIRNQLVAFVTTLGIQPITGKPGRPTTQGTNERVHQTLFLWLQTQPLASSVDELQQQVDRFDDVYNNERPHQALPGRITPQAAWDLTPLAEAHRPAAAPKEIEVPEEDLTSDARLDKLHTGTRKVHGNGAVRIAGTSYQLMCDRRGQELRVAWDEARVVVVDHNGEILLDKARAPYGVRYVGNGQPPGPQPRR